MAGNMKKPLEAVIEEVIIQPKKIQPIIVNFQNGHLKDEEAEKMKCGLYNDEKKNKIVLAMSNGQTVYKGYRPNLEKELTYTMFAVRNKKTGKVRLVQAERWDVAPVLDQHVEKSHNDSIDQIGELNKLFGSKKVKRRTEQYERTKVDINNVSEQLEKTVSNVEIEKQDLEPIGKDEFVEGFNLPPCNREANEASDIYNLDDLVPKDILESLQSQVAEILESELEDKPQFFVQTVENLKNDPNCTNKIAILLFMESLANWLNIPIKQARAKDLIICPYSPEVNTYIIESYSQSSIHGRQRPKTITDKGIIYCIILGLMIWDFKLDLELFSSLFKIRLGIKKLLDLARLICAVPARDDKKSVVLKTPVPPPPPTILKKKGKINR